MIIEEIKKRFPEITQTLHKCRENYYVFLGKHFPVFLIRVWYKHIYKEQINLKNPKTISEKINWMKLNADISLWSQCADKYEVRKYVENHGLGFTLNELYGVYDSPEQIDFETLPSSFVIKTTNGGGGKSVMIIKDKNEMDIKKVRKELNEWLKQEVGYRYYEPQYIKIKPRLIIEKYLEPQEGEKSLIDFKCNCFDGQTYTVLLCSDRQFKQSVKYSIYDLNWNLYSNKVLDKYRTTKVYPRPRSLEKMIEYSNLLSQGIPFVRVDWYEINDKPVFGEMTFTPGGGFQHGYTKEYLLELGNQMHIK